MNRLVVIRGFEQQPVVVLRALPNPGRGVVSRVAAVDHERGAVGCVDARKLGKEEVGVAATRKHVSAEAALRDAAASQEVVAHTTEGGIDTQAAEEDVAVGVDAVASEAGAIEG